jgi:hypothetical protein
MMHHFQDSFVALPVVSFMLDVIFPAMPVPLLATTLSSSQIFGLIAIVGSLSLAAIITVSALYFQDRKRKMWHETARMALEKGQPLPPMPPTDEELDSRPPPGVSFAEWEQARRAQARTHDFKGGLVLIAVGLGVYLTLPPGGHLAAAIPGFIGVALLVNAVIERVSARKHATSATRPPQS